MQSKPGRGKGHNSRALITPYTYGFQHCEGDCRTPTVASIRLLARPSPPLRRGSLRLSLTGSVGDSGVCELPGPACRDRGGHEAGHADAGQETASDLV